MKALIHHQPIPIQRARMRLRILLPVSLSKQIVKSSQPSTTLKQTIQSSYTEQTDYSESIIDSSSQQQSNPGTGEPTLEILANVEPGLYKPLTELVATETRGRGKVEVLDLGVVGGGEGDV